jgi:uncharacterized protein YlxW (UPF0749 family)
MSTLAIVAIAAVVIAACIVLAYRLLTLFASKLVALHSAERAEWQQERSELKAENAELRRQLLNVQEKVETLLGEIGDMQKQLGFEQGLGAADEVKAEVKKRIERIENPPADEPEPPKRGRNGKG